MQEILLNFMLTFLKKNPVLWRLMKYKKQAELFLNFQRTGKLILKQVTLKDFILQIIGKFNVKIK